MAHQCLDIVIEFELEEEGLSVHFEQGQEFEVGQALMAAARELLSELTTRLHTQDKTLLEGILVPGVASDVLAVGEVHAHLVSEDSPEDSTVRVSLEWGLKQPEGGTPLSALMSLAIFMQDVGHDMIATCVSQGHPWVSHSE